MTGQLYPDTSVTKLQGRKADWGAFPERFPLFLPNTILTRVPYVPPTDTPSFKAEPCKYYTLHLC